MEDTPERYEAPNPTQAFEDLRAEVSVLRRAVETLSGAWEENRPPDYSPDLGRIVKGLSAVGIHLATIEKHPALRLTPAQFGQEIELAGRASVKEAVQALTQARHNTLAEREKLTEAIGTVLRKRDQAFWLIALPVLAIVLALLGSPIWLGELPFGWNTSAAAMIMRNDRWGAGLALMQAADSVGEQDAAYGYNLVRANQATLTVCYNAAVKAGKDQRCNITVPAQ